MTNELFKKDDGKLALVICPECTRENYCLNVLSGICTWCGFDVNKDG
jgi:ribosomal protein L37E